MLDWRVHGLEKAGQATKIRQAAQRVDDAEGTVDGAGDLSRQVYQVAEDVRVKA